MGHGRSGKSLVLSSVARVSRGLGTKLDVEQSSDVKKNRGVWDRELGFGHMWLGCLRRGEESEGAAQSSSKDLPGSVLKEK